MATMSPAAPPLPPILGLLDVGTSRIACVMLAMGRNAEVPFSVVGFGHQRSHGVKAGVVVDADAAEDALRATVAQAESMAGAQLDTVALAVACGRITSSHFAVGLPLAGLGSEGRSVTSADVDRLLDASRRHAEHDDRITVHANAVGARVDGRPLPGFAIGAWGKQLSLDVHAVTVDQPPVRHLLHVVERCGLRAAVLAPAPIAAALAVTTPEDRARGVVVVDIGGGTTGFAVYAQGALVCAALLPIGSNHLGFDLMRSLGVSATEAERIKKNYGIQPVAHPGAAETIVYQVTGDVPATAIQVQSRQTTRAEISTILTSRLDALLRQVRHRIDQLAIPSHLCGDVVLTGGGSQLSGLPVLASSVLGRPARLAPPLPHTNLPRMLLHPAFAAIAGLGLVYRDRAIGLHFDLPAHVLAPVAVQSVTRRRAV